MAVDLKIPRQAKANTVRYIMDGMYDRTEPHGPITGTGPNFNKAMSMFNARQDRLARRGKWRKAPAKWKTDDGTFIDPEWYIINYGVEQ